MEAAAVLAEPVDDMRCLLPLETQARPSQLRVLPPHESLPFWTLPRSGALTIASWGPVEFNDGAAHKVGLCQALHEKKQYAVGMRLPSFSLLAHPYARFREALP